MLTLRRRPLLIAGVAGLTWLSLIACGHASSPPNAAGPTTATTTSSSEPTPTPTIAPTPACTNQSQLATWSVTQLAEQTVVIPVNETNVASINAEVANGAGGVILFGASAPANLGASLRQLASRAPNGIAPLVMTDEEGGDVQRMANLVGDIPSARQLGATRTPQQIRQVALAAGQKMKANGITMDLAPVLDLDDRPGPSDTNPDGTRSFSKREAVAEAAGISFAQGLLDAGVVPVVKHFPGLGGATGNTDTMAASTVPWSTLQKDGLLPFAAAIKAGVPAVMVANARVPGLTNLPASLAPEVITTVLRGQLGFKGLVVTDSLSATAVSAAGYSVPQAAAASLAAGADLILFTSNSVATTTDQIVRTIVAAVGSGKLPRSRLEDAVGHVLTTKSVNLCKAP